MGRVRNPPPTMSFIRNFCQLGKLPGQFHAQKGGTEKKSTSECPE